jgi:hypothetical protein
MLPRREHRLLGDVLCFDGIARKMAGGGEGLAMSLLPTQLGEKIPFARFFSLA